jgi:hypothetical protein
LPADSSPPPDQPAQDGRRSLDIVIDHLLPEAHGLRGKKRVRVFVLRVLAGFTALLLALFVENRFGLLWTESSIQAEAEAQERLDLEGPAFSSQVTEAVFEPGITPYDFVFDRRLTRAEQQRLTAFVPKEHGELRDYLLSIGGRMIEYPSECCLSPTGVASGGGRATVFNLHLLTDRQAPLTINDLRANILQCRPSKAVTVVQVPPQGGGSYMGIRFDLTAENPVARINDISDQQGEPFFRHNVINLGNGAEPGNLRVESVTGGKSCKWEILAEYTDRNGSHDQTIRNGREPFFTEALPQNPEQHWILIAGGPTGSAWLECVSRNYPSDQAAWCE